MKTIRPTREEYGLTVKSTGTSALAAECTALRLWHERIPEYHIKPGVELDFTPGVRAAQTFPMILHTGAD